MSVRAQNWMIFIRRSNTYGAGGGANIRRTAAVPAPPRLADPGSRRVTPIPRMRGPDRYGCLAQSPLVLSLPVRPAGWGAAPRRAYAAVTMGLWALLTGGRPGGRLPAGGVVFAALAAVTAIGCRCLRDGLPGLIGRLTVVVGLVLPGRVLVVMVVAACAGVIAAASPGRWAPPAGMESAAGAAGRLSSRNRWRAERPGPCPPAPGSLRSGSGRGWPRRSPGRPGRSPGRDGR